MSSDAATAANATSTSLPRIDALSGGSGDGPDQDLEQPRMGLGSSLPAADTRAKTEGTFPYAA
ncbi:hypothetical protein G3M53_02105, partial [Streptomyces sp. SID7982]|nr:hypothetical protein [Streptomyces sp. SID7982]